MVNESDLVTLFLYGMAAGMGLYFLVWFLGLGIGKTIAFFVAISK